MTLFIPSSARAVCDVLGSDGLVGHWPMNETSGVTITDTVGAHNLSYQGNSSPANVISDTAVIGTGVQFDSNVAGGTYTDSGAVFSAADNFSFSGWVRQDLYDAGAVNVVFANSHASIPYFSWQLAFDSGGDVTFQLADNEGSFSWDEARWDGPVTVGDWYHYAAVKEGNSLKLYVNGTDSTDSGGTFSGTYIGSAGGLALSNGYFSPDSNFTGDDFRFYNRALSAEEINALYQQRSNATPAAGQMIFNTKYKQMMYCDGTDWVMAGTGSYNPPAVSFDGTNDYLLSSNLAGASESSQWSGSFWFRTTTGTEMPIIDTNFGADFRVLINYLNNNNLLRIEGLDNTSTNVFAEAADSTGIVDNDDGEWHHVMWSVDLSDATQGKNHVYIDDTQLSPAIATWVNDGLIDFDQNSANYLKIGRNENNTVELNGDLADVWMDVGTYIDLSIEANRRKFISESGMPMYLGPDGSIPTGEAPEIFLTGATEDWHTNKGSGGGLTENGTLTSATSQPADVLLGEVNWTDFSAELDLSPSGRQELAAFDANTLIFIDDTNDTLRTYSRSGKAWSLAGSGLAISGVVNAAITKLDEDSIAFIDQGNDDLRVYTWNGSTWSQTGNDLNITNLSAPAITALDDNTVALFDSTPDTLSTYSWDGSDWTLVGNSLTIAGSGDTAIAALNSSTIAFGDDANSVLQTYSWDGADWSPVGAALTANNNNPAVTALTSRHVAVVEQTADELQLYEWNGSGWTFIPNPVDSFPPLTTPTVAALSPTLVAIIDNANDYLVTYEVDSCLIEGMMFYSNDYNTMMYCNGKEWVAMGPIGGTPPADGLVAHYKLDETAATTAVADSSGNGNSGTMTGMTGASATIDDAVVGTALDFNGGDYITISNESNFDFTTQFSLSAWIRINSFTNSYETVIDKDVFILSRDVSNSGMRFSVSTANGTISTPAVDDGEWHHLVGIFSGAATDLYLYLDGELVGYQPSAGATMSTNNDSVLIGASSAGFRDWNGDIDEVHIYDRALGVEEVQMLYNYGLSQGLGGSSGDCSNPSRPEGTMFYNGTSNDLQYCNGDSWIGVGK